VEPRRQISLRIPFATLLKIGAFVLLVLCTIRLWPFILLFLMAVLLAVTIEPLVAWMGRHGVRRGLAVSVVALVLLLTAVLVFGVLLPGAGREVGDFASSMGRIRQDVVRRIPPEFGSIREAVARPETLAPKGSVGKWLQTSLVVGKYALEGIGAIALTLAVALYLLLEGKELYAWLVSFVPRSRRDRVAQTAEEVSRVVLAYMRGQVITSVLCALYVSGVLLLLRVPAALLLGLLAGILDIIPVVGTILLIALPALVASTISPGRGLLVLLALSLYHVIESYLIVPRVYGKQMRLSALTVLLAVTVGGALQGIAGMVLILPLVAAYPIVERLWLRPLVGSDTVTDHQRLEHDETGHVANDITRT
jgi:predicted PurR-regulated permease PerM